MAEAYITNLQALLSILKDTCSNDRRAKQQALSSLHATMETALVSTQDSQQDIQNMVVGVVPDLLLCTQNPMDQVREESVQLLTRCVQSVSVVPVTVFDTITHQGLERFQPGVEPTEETRLAWVMLVHTALLHTQPQQLETVLAIVQRTLVDTFPGVQKQGACLLATAARHAPVLMGYAGERPVKMTLGWLYHHHAAVRVLGLETLEAVLQNAQWIHGLVAADSDRGRAPVLPALLYDHSPLVRVALVNAMGRVLVQWSPKDRYTHAHIILPLLWTGTTDAYPDIVRASEERLAEIDHQCRVDMVEAGIAEDLQPEQKNAGLVHLVHLQWEEMFRLVLQETQHFILERQLASFEVLRLFLGYGAQKDMVKSLPMLLDTLMGMDIGSNSPLCTKVVLVATTLSALFPLSLLLDFLLPYLQANHPVSVESPTATATATVMLQACLDTHPRPLPISITKRLDPHLVST